MARDPGLEELVNDELADISGVTQKAMFGGLAWLVNGNLTFGARTDSLLVRLGKGNDAWALKIAGATPMIMGKRQMHGWIRVAPEVYGDDKVRRKLVKAALEFNRSLPMK